MSSISISQYTLEYTSTKVKFVSILCFSTLPKRMLLLSFSSLKKIEKILWLRTLVLIILSKKGTEFEEDAIGKLKPKIPSKGTFWKANPSSLKVNPNIWSSILTSAILTVSFTNSPVIFPVPYFIENTGILWSMRCFWKVLLILWLKPLCWRQPFVLHRELWTHKFEEPVSNIILKFWGGVPIDTTP